MKKLIRAGIIGILTGVLIAGVISCIILSNFIN